MRKKVLFQAVVLSFMIGAMILLWLALSRGMLSPREWAIGMLVWIAALLISMALVRKERSNRDMPSTSTVGTVVDEVVRKRALRQIRMWKIWIALLAIAFPIGVANGVAQRAWVATLGGAGISILIMSVAIREIKRLNRSLNLTRG